VVAKLAELETLISVLEQNVAQTGLRVSGGIFAHNTVKISGLITAKTGPDPSDTPEGSHPKRPALGRPADASRHLPCHCRPDPRRLLLPHQNGREGPNQGQEMPKRDGDRPTAAHNSRPARKGSPVSPRRSPGSN
jgi:hypothetical protein